MAAQDGVQAIFTAAEGGDVEEVERLLDQNSGLLEARDEDNSNMTPLICAAKNGHMEVVRLLAERGAEMEARDAIEGTAFHWAATTGHEDVVAFLFSRGADASVKDSDGSTVLHLVSWGDNVGMVRLLLQHLKGRGIDDEDAERCTALWGASLFGRTEVARALLLAGADHAITGLYLTRADDYIETTPLQTAQEEGHEDIVILFKWWEGELERGYVVHRARYHLENYSKLQRYCIAHAEVDAIFPGAPAYLRRRSSPPEVEIVASADSGEEEQEGEGGGKRKAAEQGKKEGPCEGEKQATLQYVMHDLAPELYIELMAGFH